MPPFFMECDSQGRIVWMNESARSRFAMTSSLLEAVPPAKRGDAERLIDASREESPHFILEMQANKELLPRIISGCSKPDASCILERHRNHPSCRRG